LKGRPGKTERRRRDGRQGDCGKDNTDQRKIEKDLVKREAKKRNQTLKRDRESAP